MQRDLFIVSDASKDERFADNPLVTSGPGNRFYAGAPLITPDDHAIGTLCVLDRVPRQLTTDQADALRALSRQVMSHLEMRRRILDLRHELLARGQHETRTLRLLRLARHHAHGRNEALRKHGHRLQAGANAIIAISQHALAATGANTSHEALRIIRSKARSLLNLAIEMKRTEGRHRAWR
jgi:GAF domain-containing protein